MTKSLDLVAIGRSSVDLYGQQAGGRLEDMGSFAKYVGGSPTNTAIGVARLGLKSALITRVGADHMGRFITEQLVREGVDVSAVGADPERLTALVILGIRDREQFPLIFYRENCADMAIDIGDIDERLVTCAGAVLVNGTHLSTVSVFEASLKAIEFAKSSGGKVVFDVDYRPVLWGLTGKDLGENRYVASNAVSERLQSILPYCDLVVGTEEEMRILGGNDDTISAIRAVRRTTDALLVCKLGAEGCVAFLGEIPSEVEDGLLVQGLPVEVFNVLGAGDAFMAGFLSGWLRNAPVEECCRLANACGAIVVSRHGCAPAMPTKAELDSFLGRTDIPFRVREDRDLEHLHWATTRLNHYGELSVLAIDHRSQFEELIRDLGCSDERVSQFKQLALSALDRVAGGDPRFGMLIDDRFGFSVLAELADRNYWIGRPIETPRSRPLEFEGDDDVGMELNSWPLTHVVKCLASYHPDDPPELKERQERQLLRLYSACRRTGHELLLEIIPPSHLTVDEETTARALDRLYDIGIRPDWWKLEPSSDQSAWANIVRVIEDRDPLCRGILMLGLSAPIPDLIASFNAAARFPLIKGFAVGRSIFHDVATDWLSDRIDDEEAISTMASRLSALVEGWRSARAESGAGQ
ncbi:5-dehydro-2-deoxygluconokinase [Sphingomonas sp. NSE70-1]|uniref:5-dehydro-2-deoxygluconokinase n=1 Tax=Sphingomonas caseinilyticus TaxID=2908205 RepID=A0ABT0RWW9_9SPHN|nr:5-dehydro-2-deoxygluconokinase [Sphingomonas caseinilyticus]MCL6699519.1 5-dehydro-2-deoxygluconokinase [Sphingomonas caseinilyticus]